LQVKLCDPYLSALKVVTMMRYTDGRILYYGRSRRRVNLRLHGMLCSAASPHAASLFSVFDILPQPNATQSVCERTAPTPLNTFALYKPFTYLLTYLTWFVCATMQQSCRFVQMTGLYTRQLAESHDRVCFEDYISSTVSAFFLCCYDVHKSTRTSTASDFAPRRQFRLHLLSTLAL